MPGDFPGAIPTNTEIEHLAHHGCPWWIDLEPSWLVRTPGRVLDDLIEQGYVNMMSLEQGRFLLAAEAVTDTLGHGTALRGYM
jgi:hypothetical protein